MEPRYSEWKPMINGKNQREMIYCPTCQRPIAYMTHRYITDRNNETSEQFRVECPGCTQKGKTYQRMSVASISWGGMEHIKNPPKEIPEKRRGPRITYIRTEENDGNDLYSR